jgi:hypothetical protein
MHPFFPGRHPLSLGCLDLFLFFWAKLVTWPDNLFMIFLGQLHNPLPLSLVIYDGIEYWVDGIQNYQPSLTMMMGLDKKYSYTILHDITLPLIFHSYPIPVIVILCIIMYQ